MKAIIFILIGTFLIVGFNSLYVLDQRQQALILQFGEPVDVVKKPGLHIKIPIAQDVIIYDNRILDLNAKPSEVIDNSQKPLIVDAFIKYKITNTLKFYQAVKGEAKARQRLNTFLDDSLREVMGEVQLNALLTGERSKVMKTISDNVKIKASDIGVEVVDVRIMRADFPIENSKQIYNRMRTEREREAKEFRAEGAEKAQMITAKADKERTILLAEADKISQITRGEGEGEATRIFAESFGKDEKFFDFYRSMQAYKATLTSSDTTMVLSPDSEYLKYFGSISGKISK